MIVIYVPEARRMMARGRRTPSGVRRGGRRQRSRGRSSRPASHFSPEDAYQLKTGPLIHDNCQTQNPDKQVKGPSEEINVNKGINFHISLTLNDCTTYSATVSFSPSASVQPDSGESSAFIQYRVARHVKCTERKNRGQSTVTHQFDF